MKHILTILSLAALCGGAWAHSWYDPGCCSGRDCEPLPPEAVTETATGWHVAYWSKRGFYIEIDVPAKDARHSQDGRFHGCASPSRFYCLYVPSTV